VSRRQIKACVTGRPAEAVQYGCCAQGGAKATSADKYGVPQPPQMRGKGGGGSGCCGGEEDGGLGVPLNGNTVVGTPAPKSVGY